MAAFRWCSAALTPGGLTQASGELATGSQQATFDAMNLFLGLLTDPFIAGRNGGVAPGGGATPYRRDERRSAPTPRRTRMRRTTPSRRFADQGRGRAQRSVRSALERVGRGLSAAAANTNGNAVLGSNTATARAFGFAAGADYRISPATLAGFALAGGGTNFSVNGFGTGRSDLFQAGAFVRHTCRRGLCHRRRWPMAGRT